MATYDNFDDFKESLVSVIKTFPTMNFKVEVTKRTGGLTFLVSSPMTSLTAKLRLAISEDNCYLVGTTTIRQALQDVFSHYKSSEIQKGIDAQEDNERKKMQEESFLRIRKEGIKRLKVQGAEKYKNNLDKEERIKRIQPALDKIILETNSSVIEGVEQTLAEWQQEESEHYLSLALIRVENELELHDSYHVELIEHSANDGYSPPSTTEKLYNIFSNVESAVDYCRTMILENELFYHKHHH
ncbi:MAG: hypothetical protein HRT53_21055 [Colwellia sp.]|nr:hypothetical protein [Colwellia sp.]